MIEKYQIRKVSHKECYPFLLKIHYAKRIPNICHSFGLFDLEKNVIVGVITFGLPPAPTEQIEWKEFNFLELNRLCLIKPLERNVLSYFVSNSLKQLPQNSVIISYADMDYNHSGYIYQATNWIYTGIGSVGTKTFVMKDGKERHSRHLHLIDMNKVKEIKKSRGKHRYFYFIGNKKQRRYFLETLQKRYKILGYPKDKNKYYEIKNKIPLQNSLDGFFGTQKSKISSPKLSPTEITSPNPNIKSNSVCRGEAN